MAKANKQTIEKFLWKKDEIIFKFPSFYLMICISECLSVHFFCLPPENITLYDKQTHDETFKVLQMLFFVAVFFSVFSNLCS